ncbi:MAG: class I SAM-dependent methyltransferase [Lewinellaceae bacterium]|nr:class I SAM-dependent methyltransferase [Lewinellaceae bacterium]
MNYGCGSTANPRDLVNSPSVLYVGVGGGMGPLQFAYFSWRPGAVIGVDVVDEMMSLSRQPAPGGAGKRLVPRRICGNSERNALDLPVMDNSVDIAAQNCLFNIFETEDLRRALKEMCRVLKPRAGLCSIPRLAPCYARKPARRRTPARSLFSAPLPASGIY